MLSAYIHFPLLFSMQTYEFENNSNRFKNQGVGRLKYLFKVTQQDNWVTRVQFQIILTLKHTLFNYYTSYGHPLSFKGKQQQLQTNINHSITLLHFLLSQLGYPYTDGILMLFILTIYRRCDKLILPEYDCQFLFNRSVITFFTGYTLYLLYLSLL